MWASLQPTPVSPLEVRWSVTLSNFHSVGVYCLWTVTKCIPIFKSVFFQTVFCEVYPAYASSNMCEFINKAKLYLVFRVLFRETWSKLNFCVDEHWRHQIWPWVGFSESAAVTADLNSLVGGLRIKGQSNSQTNYITWTLVWLTFVVFKLNPKPWDGNIEVPDPPIFFSVSCKNIREAVRLLCVKWESVPSLEKWPMPLTGPNWTGFPGAISPKLTPTGQLWGEIDIVPNLPLICGCHRWIVGSNWGVGREAWWVIGGLATSGSSDTNHQVGSKKENDISSSNHFFWKRCFFMIP